jgi:hypothetical protein
MFSGSRIDADGLHTFALDVEIRFVADPCHGLESGRLSIVLHPFLVLDDRHRIQLDTESGDGTETQGAAKSMAIVGRWRFMKLPPARKSIAVVGIFLARDSSR